MLCNVPYQFLDTSKLSQLSFLGSQMSPNFTWWHPTRLLIHRHTILTPMTALKEQEEERSKAWPLQKAIPEQECSSASRHLALFRGCSQLWGARTGAPHPSLSHTHALELWREGGISHSVISQGLLLQPFASQVLLCHVIIPVKPETVYFGLRFCSLVHTMACEKVY